MDSIFLLRHSTITHTSTSAHGHSIRHRVTAIRAHYFYQFKFSCAFWKSLTGCIKKVWDFRSISARVSVLVVVVAAVLSPPRTSLILVAPSAAAAVVLAWMLLLAVAPLPALVTAGHGDDVVAAEEHPSIEMNR